MNIIQTPAKTIAAHIISIDNDWQNTYIINDNPNTHEISILIPSKDSFSPFRFVLWSSTTSTTYAQAQSMNSGLGYGTSDLNIAISSYLSGIQS